MSHVDKEVVKRLKNQAIETRKDVIVYCNRVGGAHIGGCLSLTDMAVALYFHYLNFDPKDYKNPNRDRLILSKGHCANLLYNIFMELGMFTRDEIYSEYNKIDGRFGQHPNRFYLPMFEASTGSLGHGLSIAFGYAMAGRVDRAPWRVYCIVGDGELDEGSNWEALMAAAHYQLGNLVLIVDRNRIQGSRPTEETVALDPLEDKLEAFNWQVFSIDGNDMGQVCDVLENLPPVDAVTPHKPIAIVSNTIKGKGVDFMENQPKWHLGSLDDEMVQKAIDSVEAMRK